MQPVEIVPVVAEVAIGLNGGNNFRQFLSHSSNMSVYSRLVERDPKQDYSDLSVCLIAHLLAHIACAIPIRLRRAQQTLVC